jgi:copper ion binding protein
MTESVSIKVNGMKCNGCENKVHTGLGGLDGVISVKASHQGKQVDVEYDPAKIDIEEIEDAIVDAGFTLG